ncbi:MAG: 16S rRNA (guanine(527)-N(7))-methyltransferase RsmG [Ardenticatenia bacterium]|nr:16S rRNA (guanine(527)-N(7))-methyltransferase RsmG [Ardenticatenia bacterium]
MSTHPLDVAPVPLSAQQRRLLERYVELLLTWNRRMNLTAATSPEEIYTRHLLDALTLVPLVEARLVPKRLVDVGSGAGLPGVPLAVARPAWHVTLVEATGKKVRFLETVVDELGLTNVRVQHGRAEAVAHEPDHRQQYDVATARAVAKLPVLVELCLPFVRVGGYVMAPKGPDPEEELKVATRALARLGGRIEEVLPVQVPGLSGARTVIVIHKVRSTPQQYPRPPGRPAKRPLGA